MKNNKKILITGTDTGIGKTTFGALLASYLKEHQISFSFIKPIETGCLTSETGELVAADVTLLSEAGGQPCRVYYRFPSPVAPIVASRAAGKPIDIELIKNEINRASEESEIVLVEGAGGVLVPIVERYTYAELAKDCGLEALIIFGSRLGAINQAALTFEVLRGRGINVIGYVYNQPFPADEEEHEADKGIVTAVETNRELMQQVASWYEVKELGCLAYFGKHVTIDRVRAQSQDVAFTKIVEQLLN